MIELQVTGMSCDGCAKAVTQAIRRRDAAARVEVDLGAGRVRVDGALSRADAAEAVADAGFEVAA